jgi:branched-subunit amino acid ABC-type transport system permease component
MASTGWGCVVNRGWRQAGPLLGVCAIALLLASCARWPDAAQARVCRSLVPLINAPESHIEVRSTTPLARGAGVQVSYWVQTPNETERSRILVCRFASASLTSGERQDLTDVISDAQPLGPLRLHFLKRFWLGSSDAMAGDPAPYLVVGRLPHLPSGLAFGLQHFISALPLISMYALLAPAYALIYGLVGRINLAFGEFAALAGYGTLLAIAGTGSGAGVVVILIAGLAAGLWTATVHGYAIGRLMFAPLMARTTGQQALIGTVGLAIALQEYLRLSQGAALRWVEPILNVPIGLARSDTFVVTVTLIALVVTATSLAAIATLLLLMQRSRFGRAWRACAEDAVAARLCGVSPDATLATTFVLATGLAGLAGVIMTFFYGGVGHAGGMVLGLKALIAAVAGGIGSVPGAFLGGLLVGSVEALWSAILPIEHRDLAIFALLAVLLAWRPGGVLGFGDEVPRRV